MVGMDIVLLGGHYSRHKSLTVDVLPDIYKFCSHFFVKIQNVMKKILFLSLFIVSLSSYGQISKLRTTDVAYRYKQDNKWTEWSAWKKTSVLVSINFSDKRITINSNKTQTYDILDAVIGDNERTTNYYCMDNEGHRCYMIIDSTDQQLHIVYNDWQHVYKVYFID